MSNNNNCLSGTGKVFSFTLKQILKSRSNIISFIIMILFSLLSVPIMTIANGPVTVKESVMQYDDEAVPEINYSVSVHTEEEYRNPDTSVDFDGVFFVQYVYSILVMILCLLSSTFIIRSVIEEKDSKLIELLMVSVQPLALILGKILSIMLYIFGLILSLAVGVVISYVVSSAFLHVPSITEMLSSMGMQMNLLNIGYDTIIIILVSLLLGFATFAVLAGLMGTCCSSMDEVESANMVVVFIVIAGYLAACISPAFTGPAGHVIMSLVPVISTFCAPVQYVCGNISLITLIISWGIQLLILCALSFFTAKIYRSLLLYKGKRPGIKKLLAMFKSERKEASL